MELKHWENKDSLKTMVEKFNQLVDSFQTISNSVDESVKSSNKVKTELGELSALSTTETSTIVSSINSLMVELNALKTRLGELEKKVH